MHKSAKYLLVQFGLNIGLKLIAMTVGLYQLYWITSTSSISQYYEYNLAGSYLGILGLVAGFGIYAVLQKELTNISHDESRQSKVWTALFALRLLVVGIGFLAAAAIAILEPQISVQLVMLLFLQTALVLVDYNYFAVYAVKGDIWKFTTTDLVGKGMSLGVLLLWFVGIKISSNPVLHFVIAQVIGTCISLTLDAYVNKSHVLWGKLDWALLKSLMPSLSIIALSWLILGLYQQSQVIVLTYFGASKQVINSFALAFTLVGQALLAVGVLNTQLASNIKQVLDKQANTTLKLNYLYKNLILYFGVLVTGYLALVLLGPTVLKILDGSSLYLATATALLPILGIFVITSTLSALLTYLGVFYHQEVTQLKAVIVQLILSVIGYWLLVPNYGVYGVAWTVVVVSIIDVVLLRFWVVYKLITKVDKPLQN